MLHMCIYMYMCTHTMYQHICMFQGGSDSSEENGDGDSSDEEGEEVRHFLFLT